MCFTRHFYLSLCNGKPVDVAFEVAQEMRRRGMPAPVRLYASANRAPHLSAKVHDNDQVCLAELPYHAFWQ